MHFKAGLRDLMWPTSMSASCQSWTSCQSHFYLWDFINKGAIIFTSIPTGTFSVTILCVTAREICTAAHYQSHLKAAYIVYVLVLDLASIFHAFEWRASGCCHVCRPHVVKKPIVLRETLFKGLAFSADARRVEAAGLGMVWGVTMGCQILFLIQMQRGEHGKAVKNWYANVLLNAICYR